MKKISLIIKWFLYITASILIVCAINYSLAGEETLAGNTLWNILLAGLLTTIVTVCLYPRGINPAKIKGETGDSLPAISVKAVFAFQVLLHFLALCVVMILCGHWFGWISFTFKGILSMMGDVAIVYILVFCAHYLIDLKEADAINRKLREQFHED